MRSVTFKKQVGNLRRASPADALQRMDWPSLGCGGLTRGGQILPSSQPQQLPARQAQAAGTQDGAEEELAPAGPRLWPGQARWCLPPKTSTCWGREGGEVESLTPLVFTRKLKATTRLTGKIKSLKANELLVRSPTTFRRQRCGGDTAF